MVGRRVIPCVHVCMLLVLGSTAFGDERQGIAEFIAVKDEAWRSSLPLVLRISETHEANGNTRRRNIWVAKNQMQYEEQVYSAGNQLTQRCYAVWTGSEWFAAATNPEHGDAWHAINSRNPPDGRLLWSMRWLWEYPDATHTLGELLSQGPVLSTSEDDHEVVLDVAASRFVATALKTGQEFGGLSGYRIAVAKKRQWRPVRIDAVGFNITEDGRTLQYPEVGFAGRKAQLLYSITYGDWARVADVDVPTSAKRVVFLGGEATGAETTVKATVSILQSLPPDVRFKRIPPLEFGPTGLVTDRIRRTTERLDLGTEAEVLRARERALEMASQAGDSIRDGKERSSGLAAAALVVAGICVALGVVVGLAVRWKRIVH